MVSADSICSMVEQMGLFICMYMSKLDVQSKLFIQDFSILTGEMNTSRKWSILFQDRC